MSKFHSRFQSTCWAHFHQLSSNNSQEVKQAMNEICTTYWQPLFHFALSIGCSSEDAEDCVQGFLSATTSNNFFMIADPSKGRMRSYLLVSFKRYIFDTWKKSNAQKRGGAKQTMPLQDETLSSSELDPALAYDQQWAMNIVETAKLNLKKRYCQQGKSVLYGALEVCIDGSPLNNFTKVSKELNLSTSALKSAIHRIRNRFGEEVHSAVAETVANESEVDSELSWLVEVLSK